MCIQSSMPGQHPPSGFLQSGQRNSFPRVPQRPFLCVTVCLSRKLQVKGTEGKWDNKSHCHVKFELCVLDKDNQASKGFQVNKGRLFRLIFLLLSGLSSLLCFLFLSEKWSRQLRLGPKGGLSSTSRTSDCQGWGAPLRSRHSGTAQRAF